MQGKHGLRAIKKSRLTGALATLSVEAARNLGNEDVQELAEAFEGGIRDITQTLVNSGYARGLESEADAAAVTILQRVGYDRGALPAMLREMQSRYDPSGPGFARTHPSPADRIAGLEASVRDAAPADPPAKRQRRFVAAVGGL